MTNKDICDTCGENKPVQYEVYEYTTAQNAVIYPFCSAQCLRLWAKLECERMLGYEIP